MFLFTNLDNDVELMIAAEVKELTKFRECTREFKRMIKVNHRFIEHSKCIRFHIAGVDVVGPNLRDGNVYLRMVCMGVVNLSYMKVGTTAPPLHGNLTMWEDPVSTPFFGNGYDHCRTKWVGKNNIDNMDRVAECRPKVELLEFDREQERDKWGIKSEWPLHHARTSRRCDPIPSHIKGIKLLPGGNYHTCAELDIILRYLGASGYESKTKAEKVAMWWKITINQKDGVIL
jgi:hypothetical protein